MSNAFLFFFAGFHTTSQAIRMLMYNLTVHPEYQDKVIEEVESNVGDEVGITFMSIYFRTIPFEKIVIGHYVNSNIVGHHADLA